MEMEPETPRRRAAGGITRGSSAWSSTDSSNGSGEPRLAAGTSKQSLGLANLSSAASPA